MNVRQCCITLVGILLLSAMNTVSLIWAGPAIHVGKIEPVDEEESDTASYLFSLVRNGKEMKVYWGMPVNLGDEILPGYEGRVQLVYVKTNFKALKINERTTVTLPEEMTASFHGNKEEIELRSKSRDKDRPFCFPPAPLCFSPLPGNGSTLLPGEAILFRWHSVRDVDPCEKIRLVVTSDKGEPCIEEDMNAGELKVVNAKLQAGKKYEWFVKYKENKESEKYAFSVLDEDTSKVIRGQLDNIAKNYNDSSPLLYQALYLKLISNNTQDFYADSVRLLKKYMDQTLKSD